MKQFFAFMAAAMISLSSFAQLPNGSVAPDWTLTSVDSVEYNLYSLLDSGYAVIIDFSATWCPPCWSYHESGVLETLHETYGPDGTNEIRVFFIEGDDDTNLADLNGETIASMGDWLEGTGYPVIDNGGSTFDDYAATYFPTIYTICPSGRLTESGQVSVEAHVDIFSANACQPATQDNDACLVEYTGETLACGENPVSLEVDLMNLGLTNLTACTIKAYEGTNEVASVDWTGNLDTYGMASVVVGETSVTSPTDFTFEISSSDDNANNNSVAASVDVSAESTTYVRVRILTDAYPTETGWSITDENGMQVAGSPTQSLTESGTEYIWHVGLDFGCYTFNITDAFGDGLASSWYNGTGPDGEFQVLSMDGETVIDELLTWSWDTDDWFSSLDKGFEVKSAAGVEEADLATTLNVYPNPTNGLTTLEFNNGASGMANLEVFNLVGERVVAESYGNLASGENRIQLDLSGLNAGIYLVNLNVAGETTTLRLTKQ